MAGDREGMEKVVGLSGDGQTCSSRPQTNKQDPAPQRPKASPHGKQPAAEQHHHHVPHRLCCLHAGHGRQLVLAAVSLPSRLPRRCFTCSAASTAATRAAPASRPPDASTNRTISSFTTSCAGRREKMRRPKLEDVQTRKCGSRNQPNYIERHHGDDRNCMISSAAQTAACLLPLPTARHTAATAASPAVPSHRFDGRLASGRRTQCSGAACPFRVLDLTE